MTRPATQKIQRRSPFPALVKTAISAIALLAGAAIGPASAEKIANVSSGPWKGGVYTSDKPRPQYVNKINLEDIISGKTPDLAIQEGDLIFVKESFF